MSEEDIVGLFSTSLEIFASYYTDICQNYYPAIENSEDITASASSEDPLAAALGSKLTYRPASDVPGPQVIYKEGGTPASTDFITKAIQGYGTTSSSDEKTYENESTQGISSDISSDHEDEVSSFVNKAALEADDDEVPARKTGNYSTGTASVTGAGTNRITDNRNSNAFCIFYIFWKFYGCRNSHRCICFYHS